MDQKRPHKRKTPIEVTPYSRETRTLIQQCNVGIDQTRRHKSSLVSQTTD